MKVPALVILALLAAAGCGPKSPDPGVPAGADLLTEVVCPAGQRSDFGGPVAYPMAGAVYVFDATRRTVVYQGPLREGDKLRLSDGGLMVVGRLPSKMGTVTRYERQVARYDPGHRYKVYFAPGASVANPTPDAGSPLTRPFDERDVNVDPTGTYKPAGPGRP